MDCRGDTEHSEIFKEEEGMTHVFVVMCNDEPVRAYTSRGKAIKHCLEMEKEGDDPLEYNIKIYAGNNGVFINTISPSLGGTWRGVM